MGQGNDRGSQYRSGLYYFDDEQKALIEASAAAYGSALEKAGKGQGPITTEIRAASDYPEIFYYAEVPLFSPCLSCVCVCGLLAQAQLCFCCCGGWLAGWLPACLPAPRVVTTWSRVCAACRLLCAVCCVRPLCLAGVPPAVSRQARSAALLLRAATVRVAPALRRVVPEPRAAGAPLRQHAAGAVLVCAADLPWRRQRRRRLLLLRCNGGRTRSISTPRHHPVMIVAPP
jgi:hypothetical protein